MFHIDAKHWNPQPPSAKLRRATDADLVALLDSGKNFTDIGEVYGVSRERIRQIYNKRIRDQFYGGMDGRDVWMRNMAIAREMILSSTPSNLDPILKVVLAWAKRHRLHVELERTAIRTYARYVKTKSLLIEGRRCVIHHDLSNGWCDKSGKRKYWRIQKVSVKWAEFCIAVAGKEKHIFVIPTEAMRTMAYIPPAPDLPTYHNIHPKIDWWQYKDATGLLRGQV